MSAQAGLFGLIKIDDTDGAASQTLTDITTEVVSIETPRNAAQIDVTTFASSGAQSTKNMRRGAIEAPVTITVNMNSTTISIVQRMIGRRVLAVTIERHIGLNAVPTTNAAKFTGEYVLLSVEPQIGVGKALTMKLNFKPSAVSSTVPNWTRA